jgi:CheY-like chemotaxis protein
LVVDDDLGVRSVLQFLFERCGFTVLTAGDGSSALEILLRANEIRLVLLDLMLPDTDGEAVFRVMRQICPDLPAILCSGYLDENDVNERLGAGWAAVIRKPFRLDAVMQTVRAVLGD